jgi:AcrR family transcriptional regulator
MDSSVRITTMPTLSGRRAEASRNDERVLAAARAVLTTDPVAAMADIARRAGVGIGTLYRRYPSKEALVQHLCLDGMRQLEAVTRSALQRVDDDPWDAFATWMRDALAAGAGSLGAALAGTFTPTDELLGAARELYATGQELIERVKAAGALRADVTQEDVNLLFEQLRAVRLGDDERTAELQRRYLALMLQALRAPGVAPLPGSPPAWAEIRSRWQS